MSYQYSTVQESITHNRMVICWCLGATNDMQVPYSGSDGLCSIAAATEPGIHWGITGGNVCGYRIQAVGFSSCRKLGRRDRCWDPMAAFHLILRSLRQFLWQWLIKCQLVQYLLVPTLLLPSSIKVPAKNFQIPWLCNASWVSKLRTGNLG